MGEEKINIKDFRIKLDFEPFDLLDFVLDKTDFDDGFDAWHYYLMDREYENSSGITDFLESNTYNITSITANKNKGVTTVVFEDGASSNALERATDWLNNKKIYNEELKNCKVVKVKIEEVENE